MAGVDEAGRGPIAGPVVVAAVVLGAPGEDLDLPLDDSKRLDEGTREALFDPIRAGAAAYRIVVVHPDEIDRRNILQATLWGMGRAVMALDPRPDWVLVDGNKYPRVPIPGEAVVKGDSRSRSVAAASVLAKVARDRIMRGWARIYPQYRLEEHKGYPTPAHQALVAEHGLSPIHRRSFRCGPHEPRPAGGPEQLDLFGGGA